MKATNPSAEQDGLRVVVYPGNNKILLAMSLADDKVSGGQNLAGFAIWRTMTGKAEQILSNRISFTIPAASAIAADKWTGSDKAPFQKFRWVDVPQDGFDQPITYRIKALYFTGQGQAMKDGPQVTIQVAPVAQHHAKFHPGFTRGYIASQAYTDKFKNEDIRPAPPKTPTFDTKLFQPQYQWLGADARVKLFDFIAECEADKQAKVNVFAYDLDEPDVVSAICRMGKEGRLRAILDNAPLHTKAGAPEVEAAMMIIAAVGETNVPPKKREFVKQGKFARFQHNKVFIKRDANGNAQRVLFGSMNFSVRGLYVQANNVIVVDDPNVAGMFAKAFDAAFKGNVAAAAFQQDPISAGFMVGSATDTPDLPKFSLALSPHKDSSVSLGPVSARIRAATSSVLFAVMEPTGSGPVLTSLQAIAENPVVFSYGTVETDSGLAVQSPGGAMGEVTGFAALVKNVPPPFNKEFGGGSGMHIHDKFVVVDFNGDNPTVFTGSSNLAAGGEEANGDSLAMIEDESIANMYAIEAVAMFDHYHFRSAAQKATTVQPLTLWFPGKPQTPDPWWKQYYDPTKIQMRDRILFAGLPLPPGLSPTKTVDWSSIDSKAAAKKGSKKASSKKPAAKKATTTKKTTAKKATAKKATKKKATSTKTTAKKATAKKKTAKKATAKKPAAKKPATKKATAKKAPAKKKASAAKKTSAKRKASPARGKATGKKPAKKARR